MSNKGEDVKHLFAHLGLDPSTYRDIKGDEASANAQKPSRRKSRAKKKPVDPAVAPEDMPPPPRVQRAEERPDVPPPGAPEAPEISAPPEPEEVVEQTQDPVEAATDPAEELVETDAEPSDTEEPVFMDAGDDEIEVSPDRWALLAQLGDQNFPVAEIPDAPVELGAWSRESGPDQEADTDRLKRAGSLSALLRGSERVVESVKRSVSSAELPDEAPTPVPADDDASDPAPIEAVEAATEAEPSDAAPAQRKQETEMAQSRDDAGPGRQTPVQDAAKRPSSGAIAKLMGRLGQPPAPRRHEGAKLKLRYERREAPVVAENQMDQRLPSVFGRLEKSRVD